MFSVRPAVVPPVDGGLWKRLLRQKRARAEARIAELKIVFRESQARAGQFRRESINARSELNPLRAVSGRNRRKLAAIRAKLKEMHRSRSARNARRLEKKVALLRAASIESGRNSAAGLRRGDLPAEGTGRKTGGAALIWGAAVASFLLRGQGSSAAGSACPFGAFQEFSHHIGALVSLILRMAFSATAR